MPPLNTASSRSIQTADAEKQIWDKKGRGIPWPTQNTWQHSWYVQHLRHQALSVQRINIVYGGGRQGALEKLLDRLHHFAWRKKVLHDAEEYFMQQRYRCFPDWVFNSNAYYRTHTSQNVKRQTSSFLQKWTIFGRNSIIACSKQIFHVLQTLKHYWCTCRSVKHRLCSHVTKTTWSNW